MNLNVKSVIEASQAAVPTWKSRAAAPSSMGSIAGADGGGPGPALCLRQAYVHNLPAMARDLAPGKSGSTPLPPASSKPPSMRHSAERMEAMKKSVPLGRAGTPEDCVGPILLLASTSMGAMSPAKSPR
jgi:3-oxoacyl-[acyl-carrier protein] reductase